jgi:ADP-heptose:LPS heptosyltransferase
LKKYRLHIECEKRVFGEQLMGAFITTVLNDNGYSVVFDNERVNELVDCPIYDAEKDKDAILFVPHRDRRPKHTPLEHKERVYRFNMYTDILDQFKQQFNITKPIKITLDHVPVKFYDMPEVPSVDVVMTTSCQHPLSYKTWPPKYFTRLKKKLRKNNITFIDADKRNIRDIEFLNYVAKCKVYLSLDTGAAHYASQVGKNKTLILQSGFTKYEFWAQYYKFDHITYPMDCAPCHLRGPQNECQHRHKCMRNMTPRIIFKKIKEYL